MITFQLMFTGGIVTRVWVLEVILVFKAFKFQSHHSFLHLYCSMYLRMTSKALNQFKYLLCKVGLGQLVYLLKIRLLGI